MNKLSKKQLEKIYSSQSPEKTKVVVDKIITKYSDEIVHMSEDGYHSPYMVTLDLETGKFKKFSTLLNIRVKEDRKLTKVLGTGEEKPKTYLKDIEKWFYFYGLGNPAVLKVRSSWEAYVCFLENVAWVEEKGRGIWGVADKLSTYYDQGYDRAMVGLVPNPDQEWSWLYITGSGRGILWYAGTIYFIGMLRSKNFQSYAEKTFGPLKKSKMPKWIENYILSIFWDPVLSRYIENGLFPSDTDLYTDLFIKRNRLNRLDDYVSKKRREEEKKQFIQESKEHLAKLEEIYTRGALSYILKKVYVDGENFNPCHYKI